MAYLLDANVFIAARQLHYGFDFCPAFWDWLIQAHREGRVFSISRVAGEIQAGEGELSDWADQLDDGFFIDPDEQVLPALGTVSEWATDHRFPNGQSYTRVAVNTFLQVADYYLVSQALAGAHTVVTHERVANTTGNVKIPNACLGVRVRYMTPFEMLRKERARFVLEG